MTNSQSQCDYLVVGGGSAGCIIARRLADANAGSVILLEAGKSDELEPAILDLSRLETQGPETEWGFLAQPVNCLANRIDYSRAKMLGGCGGHNDCAFLVPPPGDFDHWGQLGARGWDWRGVSGYFDKVESMVEVDSSPPCSPVSSAFLDAGRELGLNRVNFRDEIAPGVGLFPLNARKHLRQSASVAYLHPLQQLPDNLQVRCNTSATRLLMEESCATGCQTSEGEIHARREVILCAGAIQTPQLLMISGIGHRQELQSTGIDSVVDLPGVGKHLIDHAAANVVLKLGEPIPDWRLTPCEVAMLLQLGQDEPAPDLLFHFVLGVRDKYPGRVFGFTNSVKISPNVTRPRSAGSVRLRSGSIDDPPQITLNYFSDSDGYDIDKLIQGIRFSRKIAGTSMFRELVDSELLPGPSIQSNREIADYIRDTCETVYHPAGTCTMGNPANADTVVGPDLKVKGTRNLRICDASVFPSMVTVNINNTVMMVAEKAADMIIAGQP